MSYFPLLENIKKPKKINNSTVKKLFYYIIYQNRTFPILIGEGFVIIIFTSCFTRKNMVLQLTSMQILMQNISKSRNNFKQLYHESCCLVYVLETKLKFWQWSHKSLKQN